MNLRAAIWLFPLALTACSSMNTPKLPSWMGGTKAPMEKAEGDRISVLKPASQLQPDAALAAIPADVPLADANAAWPQHSGNAQGYLGNLALAVTMENKQTASVGDGAEFKYKLITPPIVADGAVYAMDAMGRISAHDAKDVSEVRWISAGVATDDKEPVLGGGLAFFEGKLFAASGKGLVVALDPATGLERWRKPLGIPIRSAPRVDAGRVYVVTVDSQLYALDAGSGEVLWSHRGVSEGAGFLIEASPAALTDMVVAPYSSGEFHVLRADSGESVWSDAVIASQKQSASSVFSGIGGDPVIADGLLYVAGSSGVISSFSLQSGKRVWDQQVASICTPWVAGDNVYVLSSDSAVVAINRFDGRVRWVSQLAQYSSPDEKKGRLTWNGPVMAGGRLLVVGAHGEMDELSPQDGSIMSRTDIPRGVYAPPVIAGSVLYLISDSATLYAIY